MSEVRRSTCPSPPLPFRLRGNHPQRQTTSAQVTSLLTQAQSFVGSIQPVVFTEMLPVPHGCLAGSRVSCQRGCRSSAPAAVPWLSTTRSLTASKRSLPNADVQLVWWQHMKQCTKSKTESGDRYLQLPLHSHSFPGHHQHHHHHHDHHHHHHHHQHDNSNTNNITSNANKKIKIKLARNKFF